ncbi:MAG: thioesterase domain-containing protein [Alphaproteobacteria bacterium]
METEETIAETISRGGEKIAPSEVDDALMTHPDIAAAATFPVPHATLGQDVAAAVVPVEGAMLSDESVARYLGDRLAAFKVPQLILVVDEIPKGPEGTVERQGLAAAFGLAAPSSDSGAEPADDRPATPLEANLQRIWADVLRLDHVGLDEDFFMLGGDSLQAVELFLRIEKDLGRCLPRSTLFRDGTVALMAKQIEEGAPSSCLVPIQPLGNRPPFFCVHDGLGQVLSYRELSLLLGEDQPFYGIQARGIDSEEEPFVRVEDMAAHYIEEIRKVQPEGPYYIGGHSFGGRVAYVMAQQFQATGEQVAFLALLDTYSFHGRRRVETGDWFSRHVARIRALPPTRWPAYLGVRAYNIGEAIYGRLRLKGFSAAWNFYKSRGKPLPRFLCRVDIANDMIRRAYRAQPYDGDATLFKCERSARIPADAHDGWHKLVKGKLYIRPIPGTHHEIVNQPYVPALATELADALAKAQAAQATPRRSAARSRQVS